MAINPLDKNNKVPVFFANLVLMDYGFGAVFGCPGHDQRDYMFAKKYNLPITYVISKRKEEDVEYKDKAYISSGILINSGELNGTDSIDSSWLWSLSF